MESRSAHLWDQFFDEVLQWYPLGPILWWNPARVVSGTYSLPSSTVAISGTYSLTEFRSGHLWDLFSAESRNGSLWDLSFGGIPQWSSLGPILGRSSTVAISGTYSLTEFRSGHLWDLLFLGPTVVPSGTYPLVEYGRLWDLLFD
ncbi:hypothetical protein MTP99_009904 [Tenebrio molitor]|nr:hypothetical protein MTP99_009904 [Tenebrio molitor]